MTAGDLLSLTPHLEYKNTIQNIMLLQMLSGKIHKMNTTKNVIIFTDVIHTAFQVQNFVVSNFNIFLF